CLCEPAARLLGLKHHLAGMTPTEILPLAPLAALVVVFGLFPGILLDLFTSPVTEALKDVGGGTAISVDPLLVAIGLGLVVAVIAARLFTLRPGRPADDESSGALTPVEGAAG